MFRHALRKLSERQARVTCHLAVMETPASVARCRTADFADGGFGGHSRSLRRTVLDRQRLRVTNDAKYTRCEMQVFVVSFWMVIVAAIQSSCGSDIRHDVQCMAVEERKWGSLRTKVCCRSSFVRYE